jgi:DNA processing protein
MFSGSTLKLDDPDYPEILRHIYSPPKQLFYMGVAPKDFIDKPKVAIVGSRKATAYGKQVTEKLASELARAGVVIISGLALGIDACAARSALSVGGCTVAVLPTPVEQIYPAMHQNLARQIVQSGGELISEYPSGTAIYKDNFVARNRIVSGLADVLLITEAAINSGTMHTARFALDQGKTVMVVPGNISSPSSEGCNHLIKSGAGVVTNVDDIFLALGINPKKTTVKQIFKGSPNEQVVYKIISKGTIDQDHLAIKSGLDSQALSSVLTMLEINGYISAISGQWSIK